MKKAFVLFGVCTIIFSACSSEQQNKTEQEKYPVINPLVVDTVFTKEYVANINSIQNIEIRARVKGYIETIHVDEGKSVKAGQVLFSINSQYYREELAKAKALVKSAIAEAKSAELDVKNVQTLVDKSVVSKTELELAQSKLDAANAKVDEAKSDEATATLNLSFTEIRAPFDGIINRIPFKAGSLIDEGALLTTLSNNTEVFAYFNVSEKEYLDLVSINREEEKKEAVLVLANNQFHAHKGYVETVDGEFDKTTGNIAFRARFANPEGILKHGSSGKVRLQNVLKNALLIPQKSTFEIQEKIFVFVVDKNNTVQMKSFTPRYRLPSFYVVESGLTQEDKIVFEGIQRVKEGDIIIPEAITSKQMLAHKAQ